MPQIDFECPPCRGKGILWDTKTNKVVTCHKCSGLTIIQIDSERLTHHCWQCDGTGLRDGGPALCPTCRGDGYDRPGVPTGPGHAHQTLPSINSGSIDSGGTIEVTEPIMPPETEPDADVTIEMPKADLTETRHPPRVEVMESTKKRFTEAPQAVIAEARNALTTTIALQDILHGERSNSDEANEAKALLARQRVVLSAIVETLQSGGDEETARKRAVNLLEELVASTLKNMASDGPVRGTLAVAALSMASVLGVELHWGSQLLITGLFAGKETIDALREWVLKGRTDKRE